MQKVGMKWNFGNKFIESLIFYNHDDLVELCPNTPTPEMILLKRITTKLIYWNKLSQPIPRARTAIQGDVV